MVAGTRHDVSLLLGDRCQGPPQLNGLILEHGEVVTTYRGCVHTLSLAGPYQFWMVHVSHPLLARLNSVAASQRISSLLRRAALGDAAK